MTRYSFRFFETPVKIWRKLEAFALSRIHSYFFSNGFSCGLWELFGTIKTYSGIVIGGSEYHRLCGYLLYGSAFFYWTVKAEMPSIRAELRRSTWSSHPVPLRFQSLVRLQVRCWSVPVSLSTSAEVDHNDLHRRPCLHYRFLEQSRA